MKNTSDRWQKTDYITYIIEKLKQLFDKIFEKEFTEPIKAIIFEALENSYNLKSGELVKTYFGLIQAKEVSIEPTTTELLTETTSHNDIIPDSAPFLELVKEPTQTQVDKANQEVFNDYLKKAKSFILEDFDSNPELFSNITREMIENANREELIEISKMRCK